MTENNSEDLKNLLKLIDEDGLGLQEKPIIRTAQPAKVPPNVLISLPPEPNIPTPPVSIGFTKATSLSRPTPTHVSVPIDLDTAIELRQIVFGSTIHSFSRDWRKAYLHFHGAEEPLAYGLTSTKTGVRGLILSIQSYFIKSALFVKPAESHLIHPNLLTPTADVRNNTLAVAMSEILWRAGQEQRCCVCLMQNEACFNPKQANYRGDGITEKLNMFEFNQLEDVENFLKKNLHNNFQSCNSYGCVLFLYSLILSAGVQRIYQEMDAIEDDVHEKLLTDNEECTQSLINLLLTGHAVSGVHNGMMVYNSKGTVLPKPLDGMKKRSHIGFMYWNKDEEDNNRTEIGSMLMTPKFPIWMTKVNGHFGLIFSLNRELVSNYRAEHHFTLHYYTGLLSHTEPTILTIDTRVGRTLQGRTTLARKEEEEKIPPLEKCILNKWADADVDWNGTNPFV